MTDADNGKKSLGAHLSRVPEKINPEKISGGMVSEFLFWMLRSFMKYDTNRSAMARHRPANGVNPGTRSYASWDFLTQGLVDK